MSFITCVCCIFTTLTYAQWICSSDRWPCIADLNGIILLHQGSLYPIRCRDVILLLLYVILYYIALSPKL